jgi:YhcH/YjgK/YiaL family protein
MILDTLQNSAAAEALHPLFPQAFARLRELAARVDLPEGKIEILGDDIFAVVIKDSGKSKDEVQTETHRRYIDIQYTVEGMDLMGWMPLAECCAPLGYDEQKDLEFYKDRPVNWFEVKQGHFVIFFPSDAHAPMANEGNALTKIVVKIAV